VRAKPVAELRKPPLKIGAFTSPKTMAVSLEAAD
jgi:hypothetical protein